MEITKKVVDSNLSQEIKENLIMMFSNSDLTYDEKIDFLNLIINTNNNTILKYKTENKCTENL